MNKQKDPLQIFVMDLFVLLLFSKELFSVEIYACRPADHSGHIILALDEKRAVNGVIFFPKVSAFLEIFFEKSIENKKILCYIIE